MLRNLVILPDGTEICSGLGAEHVIQSATITSCVNSGTELTLGSVCSSALEVKFFTPGGNLNLRVGNEVMLYKVDDAGERTKVGVFTLEKPERPSKNTYRITGYDRVSWLDKDLTDWLAELNGWPYPLLTFAQMICDRCGLTLVNTEIPNGDFLVNKFPASKVTGRELMGWIGQLAARFCRATVDGNVEFAWYTDSGVTLSAGTDCYFFNLKYEDYQVEKIEAVQIQLADSEYGALWPEKDAGLNSYVISGNPLISVVNADLVPYLQVILNEITNSIYTPCKVTIPATIDIQPGHIVRIVDGNGTIIDTYVMSKSQKGQLDTLESTGSARRDRPTAVGRKTVAEQMDATLKRQTQFELFNKLTNYGAIQGLFMEENGQIYINATYLSTGILQSKNGTTFYLDLDEGILKMDAKELTIAGQSLGDAALGSMTQEELVKLLNGDGAAQGIFILNGQLYVNASYINSGELNASLIKAGILQSKDEGETFKLDLENGTFHMSGTGKFMAPDKKSYITVEGGQFVLYAKDGEYGDYIDIARIGFSEDSEGVDYPYFLLGHADAAGADHGKIGLLKMFSNGIWLGNSVPRESVGNFIGMPGAAGLFVNTKEPRTYIVDGEVMADAFECVFA